MHHEGPVGQRKRELRGAARPRGQHGWPGGVPCCAPTDDRMHALMQRAAGRPWQ